MTLSGNSSRVRKNSRGQNDVTNKGVVMRAPLLSRGGVAATPRRSREASFNGADGVVWPRNFWTTLPRLRELRWLRYFFLIAHPPLPCSGGEPMAPGWKAHPH